MQSTANQSALQIFEKKSIQGSNSVAGQRFETVESEWHLTLTRLSSLSPNTAGWLNRPLTFRSRHVSAP